MVYDEEGRVVVNFGKYKGRLLDEVFKQDPSYYDWMQKGDFAYDTKHKLTQLYLQFKQREKQS